MYHWDIRVYGQYNTILSKTTVTVLCRELQQLGNRD